jgi:hypothetical protein
LKERKRERRKERKKEERKKERERKKEKGETVGVFFFQRRPAVLAVQHRDFPG